MENNIVPNWAFDEAVKGDYIAKHCYAEQAHLSNEDYLEVIQD